MSELSIAILGLDRVGASVGLALRRYMTKGGNYRFNITGYDVVSHNEKQAKKMGAVDDIESKLHRAVADKDIVVMALPYEDVEPTYRRVADDLRDGVVILDVSPLKRPPLEWAEKHLSPEHHLVGITPVLNPRYLLQTDNATERAEEDLFDDSAILISPAVSCIKEAVDLAFNFCVILGSKPRFLDPLEHDMLLAFTDGLPALMGVAFFQYMMNMDNWHDLQWLTNPAFGVLTHPLKERHPDALRDEFLQNREVLTRALDGMIDGLQQFRDVLEDGDSAAIEDSLERASKEYERWINRRYSADWDRDSKMPAVDRSNTMMGTLFGGNLFKRLSGKDDD